MIFELLEPIKDALRTMCIDTIDSTANAIRLSSQRKVSQKQMKRDIEWLKVEKRCIVVDSVELFIYKLESLNFKPMVLTHIVC